MKITKTMPTNRQFFNEHGASLTAYHLIGLIGQILSGLSLAYAVFALFVQRAAGVTPALLIGLALVVGLFIELANRVLARRAIKPFVVRDAFADDPDQQRRHNILNRSYLVGLVAVALLSYLFSAVGSVYYSEDATTGPELVNLDSIKTAYEAQRADLSASFAADTAMIAGPYNLRLEAAKNRFSADSTALMRDRAQYIPCANNGNTWCKGKLTGYLARIDRASAALADTVATIAREKAAALALALDNRRAVADRLELGRESEIQAAEQSNYALEAGHAKETGFKGLIFIILTVAGQTVFYFMVYLTLQVEAGAGIGHQLEPNEFWNRPGILAELRTTASWRTERGARRLLAAIFSEPGDHQTEIPYRGLFDGVATEEDEPAEEEQQQADEPTQDVHARARTQDVTQHNHNGNHNEKRERTPGEVGSVEICENCGGDYIRRTTRQRFCSTDCRLEFHAQHHNGRRYDHVLTGRK